MRDDRAFEKGLQPFPSGHFCWQKDTPATGTTEKIKTTVKMFPVLRMHLIYLLESLAQVSSLPVCRNNTITLYIYILNISKTIVSQKCSESSETMHIKIVPLSEHSRCSEISISTKGVNTFLRKEKERTVNEQREAITPTYNMRQTVPFAWDRLRTKQRKRRNETEFCLPYYSCWILCPSVKIRYREEKFETLGVYSSHNTPHIPLF